jgi:DNA-binding MarR family transcriptional regulator
LEKDPELDLANLARAHRIEPDLINAALAELLDRRLIVETNTEDREGRKRVLTEEGCRVFNQLVAARREHLAELWPEWSPEKREEVANLIRRMVRELVPETLTHGVTNSGSSTFHDTFK